MAMFVVQHGAIFLVSQDFIGMNFEEFFAVSSSEVIMTYQYLAFCQTTPSNIP